MLMTSEYDYGKSDQDWEKPKFDINKYIDKVKFAYQKVKEFFILLKDKSILHYKEILLVIVLSSAGYGYYNMYLYPELNSHNYKSLSSLQKNTVWSKTITYEHTFKNQGFSRVLIKNVINDLNNEVVLSEAAYDYSNYFLLFLAKKYINVGIDSNVGQTKLFENNLKVAQDNMSEDDVLDRYQYLMEAVSFNNVINAHYMLSEMANSIKKIDLEIANIQEQRKTLYKPIEWQNTLEHLNNKRFELYAQFYWISQMFMDSELSLIKNALQLYARNPKSEIGVPFTFTNVSYHKIRQIVESFYRYETNQKIGKYFNEMIEDEKVLENKSYDQKLMDKYVKNLKMWAEKR